MRYVLDTPEAPAPFVDYKFQQVTWTVEAGVITGIVIKRDADRIGQASVPFTLRPSPERIAQLWAMLIEDGQAQAPDVFKPGQLADDD